MKFITCILTLALMQMSCLADGFYFCFKPACTKTYLKFNQSQMVSHLVKNHKCKKLSANQIKMPDSTVVQIKMAFMNNPMDVQNGWFWYAENDNDMNSFINAWRIAYPVSKQANTINKKNQAKIEQEPLIVMSNMRRCNKCNQEVPVRFFDAHDIDHQRSEMNQYNRRRF
jgi:hypothetical protein